MIPLVPESRQQFEHFCGDRKKKIGIIQIIHTPYLCIKTLQLSTTYVAKYGHFPNCKTRELKADPKMKCLCTINICQSIPTAGKWKHWWRRHNTNRPLMAISLFAVFPKPQQSPNSRDHVIYYPPKYPFVIGMAKLK